MDLMAYLAAAVIAIFIYIKFFKPKKDAEAFTEKLGNKFESIDDQFNAKRKQKQETIDRILEKIGNDGMESLTPEEKAFLDQNAQ
ncbi:hypothetical protein KORDIASMS9_02739 [Kordia sp. SMS9]|uniref:DUF6576 domain-containing protein n=1 Tax=Kordia sp. SMS9 TaxID=2282170 RepID=UPI000E0DB650|nr:DUF6576 domain-containing protein [Kordia sp. SMS9]AXG70499.1 hypothetical protein KORDIASMS9_02739 [Kordia sp. SMS9]